MIYTFQETRRPRFEPGEVLLGAGYGEEAMPWLMEQEKQLGSPGTASNLGVALRLQKKFPDALEWYGKALERESGFAPARLNLGILMEDMGCFDVAKEQYQHAHQLQPTQQTAFRLATALMRDGKMQEALPLWEDGRRGQTSNPVPEMAIGLHGDRILVLREGGHGVVFWMARYLKSLRGRADLVCWKGQENLLSGLARKVWDGSAVDTDDYKSYMPMLSLLMYCAPVSPEPYIHKYPHSAWIPPSGHGLVIGLCWSAAGEGVLLNLRGLPVEDLEPLRAVKARFVSLQPSGAPDWMLQPDYSEGWHKTAEVIDACDLVISVDTAVCHLAGAMGKPKWLILNVGSDWKYGLDPERTAWYPSMRLFRAKLNALNMRDAVERVAAELEQL